MSDIVSCTRMASAILLHRGEITISDIRALPLIGDESIETTEYIASILVNSFDAERFQRRTHESNIGWEEVISLRGRPIPVSQRK